MWLKKSDALSIDPLEYAIPMAALEEAFSEGVRNPVIKDYMQKAIDPTASPLDIAEHKEQLQAIYDQLVNEHEVPDELFELEQNLFKAYMEKHPEQIKEKGVDVVHDTWKAQFVNYLKDTFSEHLKAEIEKEAKVRLANGKISEQCIGSTSRS